MATVNTSILRTKLRNLVDTRSDAPTASATVGDVLSTALSLQALAAEPNTLTVASVGDLPNLKYYSSPSGMVYYITTLGIYVISSGSKWLTLDGRLIRLDSSYSTGWSWGRATYGLLGNNTATTGRSSPGSIAGGFTDWCQVDTFCRTVNAIRRDGTAWGWGMGSSGELGNGIVAVNQSSPVSVLGGFTDWCQIRAGTSSTLGLRSNGTIWSWGSNFCGKLGTGNTTNRSSPVSVIGGFTDWCQIGSGSYQSLAIRQNGTLWAWGSNSNGQLGDGTTLAKSSPVSVVGGFTDWCQVDGGSYHTIALRQNGTLWAWGSNSNGQLGTGTTVSRSSPVSVVGGFTDWCQISAGNTHNLALRQNGTLWAWGAAPGIGDNANTNRSSPVSVVGGFTDWCYITAGASSSIGIRTNGTAWSWGSNFEGQLGDNTTTNRSSPVSIVGGFANWSQISTGDRISIGITAKC